MTFPIVLKRPSTVAPRVPLHYVVAANGTFQVRQTPFFRAVTRVESLPGLEREEEDLELTFPRLPAALLEPVLAFFGAVWRLHRAEAAVLLFYDPERERFRVGVPPQIVSGWVRHDGVWRARHGVRFVAVVRPEGFLRFGSIHSHGDLPAFASSLDCEEEEWEEGLHVVYGDFDRGIPSRSATFVVAGKRFRLEPRVVLDFARPGVVVAPEAWLARVQRAPDRSAGAPHRACSNGDGSFGKEDIREGG